MPKRIRNYKASLLDDLLDPAEAAAYLNAALAELDEPDGVAVFLLALRDVVRSREVSGVARSAALGRESLYRTLSATGNPKLKSLLAILRVMGLRISVEAAVDEQRELTKPSAKSTRRKAALAKAS